MCEHIRVSEHALLQGLHNLTPDLKLDPTFGLFSKNLTFSDDKIQKH